MRKGTEHDRRARIEDLRGIFRPFWDTDEDVRAMWDSIVPLATGVGSASPQSRQAKGALPANRVAAIPPNVKVCPVCGSDVDGSCGVPGV